MQSPVLLEGACFALRNTPLRWIAERVIFGRGSFPDVEQNERDPRGRRSIGVGRDALSVVR
jgi:hypothetical protein